MSFFLFICILLSMKYILIIMCLFICSCSYKDNREDYNFLEDNSIRFIKNDTGIILLINKNDIFIR